MKITVRQNVVVSSSTEEKTKWLLQIYLIATAVYLELPIKNAATLAKQAWIKAGKPRLLSNLVTKQIPSGEIDEGKLVDTSLFKDSARQLQLARAINNVQEVNDEAHQKVCRLAGEAGSKYLSALFVPVPVKPGNISNRKEKAKAWAAYLKDNFIKLHRQGKSLSDIVATLDSLDKGPGGGSKFRRGTPKKLLPRLTISETGALFLDGVPLVTRVGGPVSIWVLRAAKIGMPVREQTEDSYVFSYAPAGGVSKQKVYKQTSVERAETSKWEKVGDFTNKIGKLKRRWISELKQGSSLGALLHFVYLTSARIGGTVGGATGASTLQAKHFRRKGNRWVVTYQGKSGQQQQHVIANNAETRLLVSWLSDQMDELSPNDYVFANDQGNPWSNQQINGFIQQTIPKATVHKLRHIKGTELAQEALDSIKLPANASQSAAEKAFKAAMEQVGAQLGHYSTRGEVTKVTPMTAIKNYIEPSIIFSWFKKRKLNVPKFMPKHSQKVGGIR